MDPIKFNPGNPGLPGIAGANGAPAGVDSTSFADMLKKSVSDVNQMQKAADQRIDAAVTGDDADIHKAVIAMERASISMQLMVQVRNKVIEAYQEIMRMPV